MKKRLFSLVIAVFLIMGLLPMAALAAESTRYIGFKTAKGAYNEGRYYTYLVSGGGDPLSANADVAYCFNMNNTYPSTVYYKMTANATEQQFIQAAKTVRDQATPINILSLSG